MPLPPDWEIGIISRQAETFALFQNEFRRFLETFQMAKSEFMGQMAALKANMASVEDQLDRIIEHSKGSNVGDLKRDLAECKSKIESVENTLHRADGLQLVIQKGLSTLLGNIDDSFDDKIEKIKSANDLKYWRFASIAAIVVQIIVGIIVIFIKKGP